MALPQIPTALRQAIDDSTIPLSLTAAREPDDPLILVNRAFCDLFGVEAADIIGRNARFPQGNETERASRNTIRKALGSEREVQVTITNYHSSGRQLDIHLVILPVMGGDGVPLFHLGASLQLPNDQKCRVLGSHLRALHEIVERVNAHRATTNQLPIDQAIAVKAGPRALIEARLATIA